MAGFREHFLRIAHRWARRMNWETLQQKARKSYLAPMYHTISDVALPHIEALYQVKNYKEFEVDLDFLLKNYQPISATDFSQQLKSGEPFTKPVLLLSFDDGLREISEGIASLLYRKGIPALFFLNNSFIDNQGLMFRYKASLLVKICNNSSQKTLFATQYLQKNHLFQGTLKNSLLALGYHQQDHLEEIARLLEYSFEDYLKKQQPYLTTEQAKHLQQQGFELGAHSLDHPVYQFISATEQIRQTKESVTGICQKFELSYRYFSFPFTDYQISEELRQNLLSENDICDLAMGCAGIQDTYHPLYLQRLPMEMGVHSAETLVKTELLYYLLKKLGGK